MRALRGCGCGGGCVSAGWASVGKRRVAGLLVALAVFLLDRGVKSYLLNGLKLWRVDAIDITPWFSLRYAQNFGVSFSMLTANSTEMRWLLVALTAAIAAGVLFWMMREKAMAEIAALGLVLGGALGNICDRAFNGHVIDYADFHIGSFRPFAIFNLADAAISIGVVIILARSFLSREKRGEGAGSQPVSPSSES